MRQGERRFRNSGHCSELHPGRLTASAGRTRALAVFAKSHDTVQIAQGGLDPGDAEGVLFASLGEGQMAALSKRARWKAVP
jgi:hypothetical protein